jgi:hypothetical protein
MTTCTTTFIIQLAAHVMEVLCVCQFVYLLLWQIKGNLESTHLKLGATGTTISSPIMLSSEHKSGVFNSYWRMHPMGRKTKPWTHPRKHPNNSQKGSVVAFGMTKKTGFLASQDTDLLNHKTPDCTLSKTEQVQFFAGSWSTWPLFYKTTSRATHLCLLDISVIDNRKI